MAHDITKIRNIGVAAHIDAGKTTTTERILYYAGKIHRMGEVDDGTTQMDWMEQEKERGITITAAATTLFWRDCQINLIDTPGHVDFTVEVERSLRALDGAVVVLCAVAGVQPQTETIWRQVRKYNVPRIIFVNKMDRSGADFEHAVETMAQKLGVIATPIVLPIGAEDSFAGIVDLIDMRAFVWNNSTSGDFETVPIPPELMDNAEIARLQMLENLAECDDEILECVLEEKSPSPDCVRAAIRKAVGECKFVPVLAGTALRNLAIQPLLDAIVDFLPSPAELPPAIGVHPKTGDEISRKPDIDAPFAALVFKIAADAFVDRLAFLRIYSGNVKVGTQYFNSRTGQKERVQKIFRVHANKREELSQAFAGDVIAVAGLRTTATGDTLCDPDKPITFERIEFPEPVIFIAVEPKSKADEDKMVKTLERLADEDPSFRYRLDSETGQTVISGMGELHLDIIVDRMLREFRVDVNIGKPQVSYRETVTEKYRSQFTLDRMMGNHHLYAVVDIEVLPAETQSGFKLSAVLPKNAEIPPEFVDAALRGINSAKDSGPIAGYPLLDMWVRVRNLEFDVEHSTPVAFEMAASQAFGGIVRSAKPALLEPVMDIEVIVPENYLGDIMGDLVSRGAEITGTDRTPDGSEIRAVVPLSEMFGYTTALRSQTQGKGFFTMQFSHYRRLPKHREEQLLHRMHGFL